MIPWSELSEREKRNVQTALHDRGIKVTLDEAEAYYGNPEKVEAEATKEGDLPENACPNCFAEVTQEGLLLEDDPGFCTECGEDLSAGGDPSKLIEEVTVPLLASHVSAIEQGAELTDTTPEGFCRDAIRGRLQALENVLAEKGSLRTDGGSVEGDRYQDGKHVVCTRGHIHHIDDLDKNGMDYACPECFAFIDSGQVTDAKYGRNEIDERYLDAASDRAGDSA